MSGIAPPSIVNYDWVVKDSDPSYLNVSFPFRVKIDAIWFTTQKIYGGTNGLYEGVVDLATTERKLSLAAFKAKNSKKQWSPTDSPTDFMNVFEDAPYGIPVNELLKPAMWLGNPDNAAGRVGAWAAGGGFGSYELNQRSTAVAPVGQGRAFNNSWSEEEHNAQTYLADIAVMNTDEFLQLFIYASGGDWTDYADDGKVTISIAYSGMWDEGAVSAPAKTWLDWWND